MSHTYQTQKRYGRNTHSTAVCSHIWPDAMKLVEAHADLHGLTKSGAVHDIVRRYFNLDTHS